MFTEHRTRPINSKEYSSICVDDQHFLQLTENVRVKSIVWGDKGNSKEKAALIDQEFQH